MEYANGRSWASTFGGLTLSASLFVGCAAEKPVPVHPETIRGPDIGLLLNRRVLISGTLTHLRDLSDSQMLPVYGASPGGPTIVGFITSSDTDYEYAAKFDARYGLVGVQTVRTDAPIHNSKVETIPAQLSGILRRTEEHELYLEDVQIEQYGFLHTEL